MSTLSAKRKQSKSKSKPKQDGKTAGAELAFKLKFTNELPEIPFDPKLLPYPHQENRHYKHFNNSLLKSKKIELLHPDGDNGLPCNPLSLGYVAKQLQIEHGKPERIKLDPEDSKLLTKPVSKDAAKLESTTVSWLRTPSLISTERQAYGSNRQSQPPGDNALRDQKIRELLSLDLNGKIRHIEKTFEDANNTLLSAIKHPKKKDLHATEVFPIFPDFDNWSISYMMVAFDDDPIGTKRGYENDEDRNVALEESILRPMVNPEDEQDAWMAYYVPTPDSVQILKRKRSDEDADQIDGEVYEEKFVREFDYQQMDTPVYPFFLEMREDQGGAFYSAIDTHLKLRRRREFGMDQIGLEKPTTVLLKYRDFSEAEKANARNAMQDLLQEELPEDDLDDF